MSTELLNEKLWSLPLVLPPSRKGVESAPNVSTSSRLYFFFKKMVKIVVSWKSETGTGERAFLGRASIDLKRWNLPPPSPCL